MDEKRATYVGFFFGKKKYIGERKKTLVFLGKCGFSDAFHDSLGSQGASGVDGFASGASNHTTNQSGQIKFNTGHGNINGVHLTEGASDDYFVFLNEKILYFRWESTD